MRTAPRIAKLGLLAWLLAVLAGCSFLPKAQVQDRQTRPSSDLPYPFPEQPGLAVESKIEFYQERVEQRPQGFLERNALAEAYLSKGRETGEDRDFAEAGRLLQESLGIMPRGNGGAQLLLAELAEAHHDFSSAIHLAQEATKNGADPQEAKAIMVGAYLESGDVETASQLAMQLLSGATTAAPLVLMARVEAARGQDEKAIDFFRQAIALEQAGDRAQSARMRALLGRIHARRGRYEEAVDLYGEALRIQPNLVLAMNLWADLELERGNWQKAEELYHRSFSFAPLPAPLLGLAQVKVAQGDQSSAESFWSRAENLLLDHLHGADQEHDHGHGHSHGHSHSHSHSESEEDVVTALGHGRDLALLFLSRRQPGDLERAVKVMEEELRLRQDVKTLEALAASYAAIGEWDQAIVTYQKALDVGFLDSGLYLGAALAFQESGQGELAESLREKAREINPHKDRASLGPLDPNS